MYLLSHRIEVLRCRLSCHRVEVCLSSHRVEVSQSSHRVEVCLSSHRVEVFRCACRLIIRSVAAENGGADQ